MLQHAALWNYASVWKPVAQAVGHGARSAATLDQDPAQPERIAFASLMRKLHSGAAPDWWAWPTGRGMAEAREPRR